MHRNYIFNELYDAVVILIHFQSSGAHICSFSDLRFFFHPARTCRDNSLPAETTPRRGDAHGRAQALRDQHRPSLLGLGAQRCVGNRRGSAPLAPSRAKAASKSQQCAFGVGNESHGDRTAAGPAAHTHTRPEQSGGCRQLRAEPTPPAAPLKRNHPGPTRGQAWEKKRHEKPQLLQRRRTKYKLRYGFNAPFLSFLGVGVSPR